MKLRIISIRSVTCDTSMTAMEETTIFFMSRCDRRRREDTHTFPARQTDRLHCIRSILPCGSVWGTVSGVESCEDAPADNVRRFIAVSRKGKGPMQILLDVPSELGRNARTQYTGVIRILRKASAYLLGRILVLEVSW